MPSGGVGRVDQVGPGAHDQPGTVDEVGLVATELIQEDPLLVVHRHAVGGGQVAEDDQDPGPLDVPQELVAEAAGPRSRPR